MNAFKEEPFGGVFATIRVPTRRPVGVAHIGNPHPNYTGFDVVVCDDGTVFRAEWEPSVSNEMRWVEETPIPGTGHD